MEAVVSRVNPSLGLCEARTTNDLLVVFHPPAGSMQLSDRLDLGNLTLEAVNEVRNLTTGSCFLVRIAAIDVHDLRLPLQHSGSRTPSSQRLRDA